MIRSETVQSLLVHLGANYLSQELKTEVTIQGLDLSVLHGLVIEDILIRDRYKDILFSAHILGVKPGKFSLKKHQLNLSKVFIDKGIIQLMTQKGDSALNLQFIIDYFASGKTTQKKDTIQTAPWDLSISNVVLQDTRFHFQDKNKPLVTVGMDYSNIDVSSINLDLTDISFAGDTIYANIQHLAARERSGFVLHNLSGEFEVSPAFLKAHNLKILTNHSDLALTFDFLYDHWGAYNDFLNEITIQTKIEPSYLDLQDIGYFAPELLVMKDRIRLSGDIKGTVANFKARNLRFAFGNNTFFWGNVSALGLPDVEETFIDLNIKAMSTNKTDIESLLIPGDLRSLELPAILSNIGVVSLKGNFTGFYNDFVANAHLNTNLGAITTDLTLKRQKGSPLLGYKGQLDAGTFDLGKLIDETSLLGRVTMRADINGQGLSLQDANLVMNVHIDSIFLNRYNYRNLDLKGALAEKIFDGRLHVRDPNLNLDFSGLIDMGDTLPKFDFSAMINQAQLFKLHLLTRDSSQNLYTRLKVDFTGTGLDNIDGMINIDSTIYTEGPHVIHMDHFSLVTKQDTAKGKSYHLKSDFADADVTGSFSFKALIPSLTTFIKNYLASFTLNDSLIAKADLSNQVMNYQVRFKQSDELTKVFLPFLQVAPNSTLYGSYNEENGSLVMKGQSPAVIVSGIEFKNWYLDTETKRDDLLIRTGSAALFLKKAAQNDSLEVKLDSFGLVSNVRHDSVHYQLSWSDHKVKSEAGGFLSLIKSPAIEIKLSHFKVFLDQKFWSVDPKNMVILDTGSVQLSNLSFYSADQYISINGNLSSKPGDTLNLTFNKVDISEVDNLLKNDQIDLDGILSGQIKLTNPGKTISVLSNLQIENLKFNHEELGNANLNITYNEHTSRFDVQSEIVYHGNIGTNIPFSLTGSYFLGKSHPHFDFDLVLKNLNLRMVNPFVKSFMSGVNGLASGKIKITGTPEKPNIAGELKLARTEFKINYLNVPYSFADIVTLDSNAFHFNNITIFDSLGHKSVLNGKITHHHFGDFRLGLNVDMTDFSAFNNTKAQNNIFYGKARGSGTVSITGPFDNISIVVKAQTAGNTHVVIPIDLTQSVGQNDYIIFVKPNYDSTGRNEYRQHVTRTGLNLDLGLRVDPEAQVEVFFPNQLGSIKANGTGNLLMGVTPITPFTLSGIYTIGKGSFLFTFRNVLRLPMQIKEGSTISWTGDPADANISVSAVYRTKAPLKGLTSITEEEAIRIPVECIIRLGGKLNNPEISFGINLPNAPEGIRNTVYSAIDTNNATTMSEQTIYLLLLNQFKPVVGTSGGTVDVGSTGMSLITNQFNSWLSGVTQNVNVNVNYKMATATTSQEFDVGISTQLFNDRLLIDGTFGMNSYNNASIKQSSTIVGDINIQYILTQNRRWRVHTFNRTNTLNILNNNAQYTQGVGLTYQRDFSSFGDLFKPSKPKTK